MTPPLATLSVLAGAYKAKRTLLTHTVNLDTGAVLCTRVDPDHMADRYSAEGDEMDAPPTCPQCKARDPRF